MSKGNTSGRMNRGRQRKKCLRNVIEDLRVLGILASRRKKQDNRIDRDARPERQRVRKKV